MESVCTWKFCCCLLGFGRVFFFFVLHKVQFSFNAFLFCWFTVQHISTTVHNKSWKIQYPLQVWLISPQYSFFFFFVSFINIIYFFFPPLRKKTKQKNRQKTKGETSQSPRTTGPSFSPPRPHLYSHSPFLLFRVHLPGHPRTPTAPRCERSPLRRSAVSLPGMRDGL